LTKSAQDIEVFSTCALGIPESRIHNRAGTTGPTTRGQEHMQTPIPIATAMLPMLALAAGLAFSGPAHASASQCDTRIDGEAVTIFFGDDPGSAIPRERFWRRGQDCPGAVVITYLMPDLSAEEREVFCANYDPKTRSHSQPAQGRRDKYGRCVEPSKTCALVNATRDETLALMGMATPQEGRERPSALSRIVHSSGALILSGNLGTLTGALGSAGTAAMASPAILAGAAASVVVIGGAVYLCSDEE
jgi:hypothetical protein